MIVVVSPTKKMKEEKTQTISGKTPYFLPQTKEIVSELQKLSLEDLQALFKVNDTLAEQIYQRYQNFKYDEHGNLALLSYSGLQYQYMNLDLGKEEWIYAKKHIRILDALYGLLEVDTSIYPYRLDMSIKLNNQNLYQYWNKKVYNQIVEDLKEHHQQVILCLASQEYAKILHPHMQGNLVLVDFYAVKQGVHKIESTTAKMARGTMISYLIKNKIETIEEIKEFNENGYCFDKERSKEQHLVFYKLGR